MRGLRWRIVAGLTGDIARRDPDGYCWFIGRADDVIESAA
ncbi:AMP-binding protein [Amycolatopsis taiwanensis]|nr:AMP-binding protein [Amycolatopsis taiwanensis]